MTQRLAPLGRSSRPCLPGQRWSASPRPRSLQLAEHLGIHSATMPRLRKSHEPRPLSQKPRRIWLSIQSNQPRALVMM